MTSPGFTQTSLQSIHNLKINGKFEENGSFLKKYKNALLADSPLGFVKGNLTEGELQDAPKPHSAGASHGRKAHRGDVRNTDSQSPPHGFRAEHGSFLTKAPT